MRVAFVGASSLSIAAAKMLVEKGHEVVIIDHDPAVIEELSDDLDCGLVEGDGSRPDVLDQVGPEQTDFLFCLADRDESNVLAALVGRSQGFERVIPRLEDAKLEPICTELGLDEVIVRDRTVGQRILDLVEGRDAPEITAVVRAGLRFFSFSIRDADVSVASLDLPDQVHVIAFSRGEESRLVDDDTRFEEGDEVVLLASEDRLEELQQRFAED